MSLLKIKDLLQDVLNLKDIFDEQIYNQLKFQIKNILNFNYLDKNEICEQYLNCIKTLFDPFDIQYLSFIHFFCFQFASDTLGTNFELLSDFYFGLIDIFELNLRHEESIECSGRSLVLRVKSLGPKHEKTAEGHLKLGILFFNARNYDSSKRELIAAKAIYNKLNQLDRLSHFIGDCDFYLAQIEVVEEKFIQAFLLFYKSYRIRFLIFGENYGSTIEALSMLNKYRNYTGNKLYVGQELKDRIGSLGWMKLSQRSLEYQVALSIFRLSDEDVITSKELNLLISSAKQMYHSIQQRSAENSFAEDTKIELSIVTIPDIYNLLDVTTPPSDSPIKLSNLHLSSATSSPFRLDGLNVSNEAINSPIMTKINLSGSPESGEINNSNLQQKEHHSEEKKSVSFGIDDVSISFDTLSPASETTKISSVNGSRPHTWRKISIHSPLRRIKNDNNLTEAINKASSSIQYLKNENNDLIMMQKCTIPQYYSNIKTKLLAFGLLAWYCQGNSLRPPPNKRQSLILRSNSQSENRSSSILLKNGQNDVDKNKKGPLETKKKALIPPPLPVSWPPVPWTGFNNKNETNNPSKEKLPEAINNPSLTSEVQQDINKPKYKQVYITGLNNVEGTFWKEPFEFLIPPEQLFNDLEDEFSLNSTKNKKSPMNAKPSPVKLPKPTQTTQTILDPQRNQNLTIMLTKLGKKSLESVTEAILNFDVNLSLAIISAIAENIPSPDESSRVLTFIKKIFSASENTGAASTSPKPINSTTMTELKIGKAEQYIYFMSKIKLLDKRLAALSFLPGSNETVQNIIKQADLLILACHEVKGSSRLKFILKVFLELNNTLAKGSKNSSPLLGFSLTSWSKFSQVKVNSGDTFQQYLINKLLSHIPECLEVANDMPSISEARSILLPRLISDMKKLEENVIILRDLVAHEKNRASVENRKSVIKSVPREESKTEKKIDEPPTDSTKVEDSISTENMNDSKNKLASFFAKKIGVPPPSKSPVVDDDLQNKPKTEEAKESISDSKAKLASFLNKKMGVPPASENTESQVTIKKPSIKRRSSVGGSAHIALVNLSSSFETLNSLFISAKSKLDVAQKEFLTLCQYFGEESPPMDPEKFFAEMNALCKALQDAITIGNNIKRRKALTSG